MSRRRKKRADTKEGSLQESSPLSAISPDAPSFHDSTSSDHRIPAPPLMTDAFKVAFERATASAKTELAFSGKIGPEAFFVYTDGTMKVVSLSFKDEFHQELLKRRIREKALAEKASAVLILAEGEHENPGMIIISGVIPGMRASARVDYAFDKNTKTITSWETHWLDSPLQNAFLDGIFDMAS
jgi:hypothetical protein